MALTGRLRLVYPLDFGVASGNLIKCVRRWSTSGTDERDKVGDTESTGKKQAFDTRLLAVIGDPLSKEPLRYDAENNRLVNDNLGVAYPIVNGMPCLNPKLGILLEDKESADETGGTEDESESIADK